MHAQTSSPKEHQLLRDVALTSSEGRTVRTSDYRGRCNLVLVFVGRSIGDEVRPLLGGCAEQYSAFDEWTAEVLAVLQGTPQEAARVKRREALPFPVLADADGRGHRAFGAVMPSGEPAAAVYIADRSGEMYLACRTSVGQALPTPQAILKWLHFIAIQCPECGVADWPPLEH